MSWKDATVRELLETPVFQEPHMWLKITVCVATLVVLVLLTNLAARRS
jgi:hypothetical protein